MQIPSGVDNHVKNLVHAYHNLGLIFKQCESFEAL